MTMRYMYDWKITAWKGIKAFVIAGLGAAIPVIQSELPVEGGLVVAIAAGILTALHNYAKQIYF